MEKTINLKEINRKLRIIEQRMVTKSELNSALESVMIMSNEDTMDQIKESEEDIKIKRIKKISSVHEI